jgi:hypothetical protein
MNILGRLMKLDRDMVLEESLMKMDVYLKLKEKIIN